MANLKIRVPIEVVVDVEAWNDEYGQNESPAEIRNVIKANSLLATQDAFAHLSFVGVHEA